MHPGADVVITIFCDFRQFSAKKLAFFSKTNRMIQFLQKLAVVRAQDAIFSTNLSAQIYFKFIT
jgi:hypothetical protein